jgi:ABC-type sulfate/molybdate transport systems, ATPase component
VSIQVDHVTKRFGSFTVLNDVSLHVQTGELIALLGPSGCGKTTLLRILAGLERPDEGKILLHGNEVTDRQITDRRVGFVFQHYALFRHMTVAENVSFGLRVLPHAQRPSPDHIQKKVNDLLCIGTVAGHGRPLPESAFRRATSTRRPGQSAGRGAEKCSC